MKNTETTLWSSLRALPPTAWILFLGMFLNKFGAFVVPFLALYLTRLGYSLGDAGVAIGAYGAGNLVASLVGGHLADSIGRRKTILLSTFSGAGSLLLMSQAHSFPLILVMAALTGLANEFYRPACSALLADLVAPEQRVTAFAAYRMSFNAGWAFGPATAGLLAAKGFLWLFVGNAAASALFGLVVLLALPADSRHESRETRWGEALGVIRRDQKFNQLLMSSFVIAFVFMQMSSTFGVHVTRLGFSAATYGALISMNGAMVVLFELPLTTITRRFPVHRVLALGYILVGLGFAMNAFAHSVAALACCIVVFTLGEMIAMPVAAAYVSNLSPTHMRGRYNGVYGLNWGLALIFAPGLGMRMLAYSPTVMWLACGGLGILAAMIISSNMRSPVMLGSAAAKPVALDPLDGG